MEEKNYFMDRFDRRIFNHHEEHFCIGEGFFGGKASGLIFIENIIKENIDFTHYPDINISVPRMVILRTNVFDTFMKRNNLYDFALNEKSDVRILDRFLKADFPVEFLGDLYSFVEKVKVPLAVRSSRLLEDAMYEPYAGVYATKMIPSNNQDTAVRFQKLIEAIKFVYASTYFKASKEYFKVSKHEIYEEKWR